MRRLSYIRLLSYAVCIAVVFLASRENRVIPITLADDPFSEESQRRDDKRMAIELASAIPRKKEFRDTRMSGQEVVAAALAVATRDAHGLSGYGEPQVTLDERDGRLVWFVSFHHIPAFPGGFFTVGIDDTTGDTTIYPGM